MYLQLAPPSTMVDHWFYRQRPAFQLSSSKMSLSTRFENCVRENTGHHHLQIFRLCKGFTQGWHRSLPGNNWLNFRIWLFSAEPSFIWRILSEISGSVLRYLSIYNKGNGQKNWTQSLRHPTVHSFKIPFFHPPLLTCNLSSSSSLAPSQSLASWLVVSD